MIDTLLRSGYEIKTRWVGDGAATTWQWAKFFETREEANEYKSKAEGATEPAYGWKLEIKIFRVELLSDEGT